MNKKESLHIGLPFFLASAALLLGIHKVHATNLSLGAEYMLRNVSVDERANSISKQNYFDQRVIGYLITDLSKDVEATLRVQSITPWGLEGSTTSLNSRYPNDNGQLWIQNAFVRLPHIWRDRVILTIGRQPIKWGDGQILSDDELGFNAVKLQIKSPWRKLDFDLEGFTAKINEGFRASEDADLHGARLSFNHNVVRWNLMGLWERSDSPRNYTMGAETSPVTASQINRTIYGIRAKASLLDAYLKGAFYLQGGHVNREGASDVTLDGTAYMIGLGGRKDTGKIGNFGAFLEISVGDGDQVGTANTDEAFRPTFASRWSGLERKGYGNYFATTFSDAYSPTNPFQKASDINDGLPEGTSGIQSIHFGVEFTPWAQWTLTIDYYQYKAQKNLTGPRELGTEFDYGLVYRYSGLIFVKGNINKFKPGDAFDADTKKNATYSTVEVGLEF